MHFSKLLAAGTCIAALALAGCASPGKRRTSTTKATPAAAPAATQDRAAAPGSAGQQDERYAKAVQLVKAGQWPAAEAAMLAMAKAYPQFSGPHANLGIIFARTNRKDQAAAAYTRAISLNPRNAVAHTGLGVLAAQSGDFAKAEQAYRAALTVDPNYGVAHLNLGLVYERHLNRPDAALVEYKLYRDNGGKNDLKAAVWIAELERQLASPAAAKPAVAGSGS